MRFDAARYRRWTWKHPAMLHWIINPGVAVNELAFGLRTPREVLIERESDKPLFERTFVPCPHCGHLHDGRTWSVENGTAFRNWFGLYCPACGDVIPCLRNLTSLAVLGFTAPLWLPFRKRLYRSWLDKQPVRYRNIRLQEAGELNWVKSGVSFGVTMFVLMTLLGQEPADWRKLLVSFLIYLAGGLCWGYSMKRFLLRKPKKQSQVNG